MAKQLTTNNEPKQLAALELGAMDFDTGGSDESNQIGRIALYQGTIEEQQAYGDVAGLKPGDFLDVDAREKLDSPKIVISFGWKSWTKWIKGQKAPVYSHRNIAEVPAEDLEWRGQKPDQTPPAAVEAFNYVVFVEGRVWPYLLQLKRTSLSAGVSLRKWEKARGMIGKPRGLYLLASTKKTNAENKPFFVVTPQPAGDCPDSMVPILLAAQQAKANIEQRASEKADEKPDTGHDDKEIPF